MPYSPVLLAHICAGTLGLLSGTAAIAFRKGSPRHVLAGKIFVVSMLIMAVGAVYVAIERNQPGNIGGGILTFYLILTAWLTARRPPGKTSRFDWLAMLVPLATGVLLWIGSIKILRSGATSANGVPVGMTLFLGTVMLLAAVGDVRMLLGGGVVGTRRIARHLWRMCLGLTLAAGSAFTNGLPRLLPGPMRVTFWNFVPQLLVLALLVFWVIRVRFTGWYASHPVPDKPPASPLPTQSPT